MNSFFSTNSFVGIDPSIPNQQLVFLLKTTPAQMSTGLINQTYQMILYYNPNAISSTSSKGLDFSAYSSS
jgi:hypothetical protein